jgi:serine/threonine protein kinase
MTISAGTRLGRYEVRSQLGAGGMGEVYLARDTTELERAVAVKVLPAELAQDPERMRRFVQEAKTASSLNHPNIITIHEIGEVDSSRYIVTEFVEGETLRQKMTRSRLSMREALDVATQIASAFVAAHRAGVVHRDIKPENVMVREDSILKVLDFGIAKLAERRPPAGADTEAPTRALVNTGPGTVMGTVSYMSPSRR